MFSVSLLLLLAAASCVNSEQLTQPASMTVQPGQALAISCQVSYSVSSYYTSWIRQPAGKGLEWIGMKYTGGSHYKDSLKNKFSITVDSSINTVTLTAQSLQTEDTAVYYCARVTGVYAFDYWGKGTVVTVTPGSPTAPTVFPLAQCGSGTGDMVTLGCIATGFTPASLTFKWTDASGTAITDFVQYPVVQSNGKYSGVSQIRVRKEDWEKKNFQCAVDHSTGEKSATVEKKVEILQSPSLYIMAPSKEELQDNKTASFACFAIDFSPKNHKIKWIKYQDDTEIAFKSISEFSTTFETKSNEGATLYRAASYLQVKDVDWTDANVKFTCVFDPESEKSPKQEKWVEYSSSDDSIECPTADIQIIPPSAEELFLQNEDPKNRKVQLTCQVTQKVAKCLKNITWEDLAGKPLASLKENNVAKLLIPYEEWKNGAGFQCAVIDSLGDKHRKTYRRENGGTWTRPSVFLLGPAEKTNSVVTLTCYVQDFYPKEVAVLWLVDDELVLGSSDIFSFNTTSVFETGNTYSVYSQLTMKANVWKKNDQIFSCVVYHETLPKTTNILVRTLESTSNKPNLVNLNLSIPPSCIAQ
nr:immunoglobulin mu heavy chain secretory form [Plecoglossus altivelis altivelis]